MTLAPKKKSGVGVDVARDGVTVPLSEARVREIIQQVCKSEKIRDAMISITFVTNRTIAKLNRDYLQHTGPTDVITFALDGAERSAPSTIVGDIYIAPDVARANAKANSVGIREELVRLVVHGTLHVLGHVHPEDESRSISPMWRKQERYVARFA